MPILKGVREKDFESLAEVLRLFYGEHHVCEGCLAAGSDEVRACFEERELADGTLELDLIYETDPGASSRLFRSSGLLPAALRRERKRLLYLALEESTGRHFPWGALTGIRPTLVARQIRSACGQTEEARSELCSRWRLSPEKAIKALQTAEREDEVLARIPEEQILVYAGIPFCPSRCSYCSFISRDAGRQKAHLGPYVDAMLQELRAFAPQLRRQVAAFYLGGGTPTSLNDADFERLLQAFLQDLPLVAGAEITVEAGRPDTISPQKLEIMAKLGVNKICINPQSMRDETLQRVGRLHTAEDTRRVFRLAREMGFRSINMDLILGLPEEAPDDFLYSLREILDLGPETITTHSLCLKRSANLNEGQRRERRSDFADTAYSAALQTADEKLAAADYEPYYLYRQKQVIAGLENTGFARLGSESRYNVGMMSDLRTVVGFGSGSSSKLVRGTLVERLHNSKDLLDYTKRIEEIIQRKADFLSSLTE